MSAGSPARIEELLAHREWVRALARALVRDPDAADDLAQDAMAKAVAAPPLKRGSIRAWFRAVMTNRARELHRNESRRGAILPDVARNARSEAASAADLAGQADMERRVLEVVLSLDEPFRGAVLLRYWRGRTPAEIAAETGVPAATVRTRLHRALALVRERMDRASGGRSAWLSALVPLTEDAPIRAPCGTTGFVRGIVASAAAVALAVVAVGLFLPARPPAPARTATGAADAARPDGDVARSETSRRPAEARPRAVPPTDAAAAAERPSPTVAPAEPPVPADLGAGTLVRIRVLTFDGSPAAAAHVRLQFWKSERIELLPPDGTPLDVRIEEGSEPPNHVFAWVGPLCGAASVPERGDDGVARVTLRLAPGRELRGRVIDESGAPVPGARITGAGEADGGAVAAASALADAEGRFELPPLPLPLWTNGATLEARAAGFAASWTGFDDIGDAVDVVVRLERGIVVTGRILDPDGNPLAGIPLSPSSGDTVETGADGRFRTDHLPAARFRLAVLPDDWAPHVVQFGSAEPGTRDIGDVRLGRGVPVRVRAVLPDGRPAANAWVGVIDPEADQYVRQGQADDEGRVTFEHLAERPIDAEAHAGDEPFAGARGAVRGATPGGDEIEVRLAVGTSVRIEFRTPDGADPVFPRDVAVKLEAEGETKGGDGGDEVQTVFSLGGSTSSVRLDAPREGAWRVTIAAKGWAPPEPFVLHLAPGGRTARVTLSPAPPK